MDLHFLGSKIYPKINTEIYAMTMNLVIHELEENVSVCDWIVSVFLLIYIDNTSALLVKHGLRKNFWLFNDEEIYRYTHICLSALILWTMTFTFGGTILKVIFIMFK